MYDENSFGGGLPEDIDYTPDQPKMGAPTGVSAPVLDDGYTVPDEKKPLVMSDDDIINGLTPELRARFDALPADKQKQVIDMRRTQLGAVAPPEEVKAPVLDEDNYTPPTKKETPAQPEAPVTAPILDDEPETPKYVRKFVDEDVERAKSEARNKVSASLVSEQKDSKESLRMMLALKEERQAELAKKGFTVTLIVAIIGVIGAVCFYLLYSGQLGLPYKENMSGISSKVEDLSLYLAAIAGVSALGLISGLNIFKTLASLSYLLLSFLQIFPGIGMIPQHEGPMPKIAALYGIALICCVAVFITLSASEAIGQFFKKEKIQYD